MNLSVSVIAVIVPITCFLIFVWRLDKYDRRQFRLILLNFLRGALGAAFIASVGSLILESGISLLFHQHRISGAAGQLMAAPVVEELAKGLFLFFTVPRKKSYNITDGFIYGGAIGLGFGMTENFLYFMADSSNLIMFVELIIMRSFFSAAMHLICTGTFGAFLYMAEFRKSAAVPVFPVIGFIIAVMIHFIWNFTVSSGLPIFIGILFILFSSALFFTVVMLSVRNERKIINRELSG
ncbi:MAG: PrsW family intramembrane metalloprotease [Ignavibacteria bacterium]